VRTVFIITCLLLIFGAFALADDGAIGSVGGNLTPMDSHPSIRMVREDVHIRTFRLNATRPYELETYCRFVFRNEGGPCTVKMGFPEDIDGNSNGFSYFHSKVDGKRVDIRKVAPVYKKGDTEVSIPRGWRVKDVYFKSNQTRIIEDVYRGRLGGSSAGDVSLKYVLTTGRSWRGPIGEAVITVDTTALKDYQTMDAMPAGFEKRGNILTWRFRNYEPQKEIGVSFWPGYSRFTINGKKGKASASFMAVEEEKMPYLESGLVMVSPEFMSRVLQWNSEWPKGTSQDSRHLSFKVNGKVIQLAAGDRKAVVDGKTIVLPRAPYLRASKYWAAKKALVVPIVPILRAFGATVTFDPKTSTTHINTEST